MVLGGNLDKWRKHPILQTSAKDVFPGLRSATIIFAVYLTGEFVYNQMTHPGLSIDPSTLKWEKEGFGEKPTLSSD